MRISIFDIETRLGPEDLSDDKDYAWIRMRAGDGGISALCIYDLFDQWIYTYDDNPLSIRAAIARLEASDLVVGFRSEGFDLPCLEGVAGRRLNLKDHIDLYALIARTNAQKGIVGKKGDFTLDACCKRALGKGKNGAGAHASQLVREGRFGELFNYCNNDVRLTRDLFLYIIERGGVPNITGSFLPLSISERFSKAVRDYLRN